jgi:hypothetical protein
MHWLQGAQPAPVSHLNRKSVLGWARTGSLGPLAERLLFHVAACAYIISLSISTTVPLLTH